MDLLKYFAPEETKKPGMVYEVWSDGEITLTKSGDIYGQRSLHMISPASIPEYYGKALAKEFPTKILNNGFASIPVKDFDAATEVRNLIKKEFENYEKIRFPDINQ